jgi:hypothetical protein
MDPNNSLNRPITAQEADRLGRALTAIDNLVKKIREQVTKKEYNFEYDDCQVPLDKGLMTAILGDINTNYMNKADTTIFIGSEKPCNTCGTHYGLKIRSL